MTTPNCSLTVDPLLARFLSEEVLPGLSISSDTFWTSFENVLDLFHDRNIALLEERQVLQQQIDKYHLERRGKPHNSEEYIQFLKDIGYIVPQGDDDFSIITDSVDPEIASIAAPQLVVPISNARFALNAANSRWGSLYDALYGTDMIAKIEKNESELSGGYDRVRGSKVIDFAKKFLNESIPLVTGSYEEVVDFSLDESKNLVLVLANDTKTQLCSPEQFVGYTVNDETGELKNILFKHNNLHIEIQRDRCHFIGKDDPASIKDVIVESAVTAIQDCEDSVAAVDAEDKVGVYRNWLGLMKGNLTSTFVKNGRSVTRSLVDDRVYTCAKSGTDLVLPGRSILLIRNVGHLMTTPAVLDRHGRQVPEGIMDALFTILIAKHDIDNPQQQRSIQNSKTGSVYIVKPKMHGPSEVQFTYDLFEAVEEVLGVKALSVKIGIMDEERRTTVNLKECIRVAKDRVIFINTGFLDRTGDEIHTSMEAGVMIPKSRMKQQPWIQAYERWNVNTGLQTGFKGKGQIGKGMWAMPDEMLAMYKTKAGHPKSGANCAWVPSPTAAILHALHYHQVAVDEEQAILSSRPSKATLNELLTIPVMSDPSELTAKEISDEIENNCQGILGYVVRWIDGGVGCSKVPDVNNVGLMEDRATCRISSQYLANWLHHGVCSTESILATMKKMAVIVDAQNNYDTGYVPMAPGFDGVAFVAACALGMEGRRQPSGYTEPILHVKRAEAKQNLKKQE